MESTSSTFQTRIVFFDGYCILCNRWADFLLRKLRSIKRESAHLVFQLAPLQGKTAEKVFGGGGHPVESIILYQVTTDGKSEFFSESSAALKILVALGFPWSVFGVFFIVPRFIRDFFYRMIARNRYSWFGKRDACRLSTAEEREWLLD